MKYSKIAIFLVFINILGCFPSITAGEGFLIKARKFSDISEFKTQKIYLDLTYEYGITKEETKTKSGKIEKTTDVGIPELYIQFKDALYSELRGNYKLDVELGQPKKKDSLSISVSPRMDYLSNTIGKASVILSKGKDPVYKLDIVNEARVEGLNIIQPKTVEKLAEMSAERIYDSILGKPEN
ncbi:hypothetical protein [Leptospira sarikeiensis]|uniref:Uncharacterized protein n=1 Tax=Leptospira sarikeiensis TaxID=2484943 RepID=A0A4R9KGZ5_9LEPT|nr:hypothetical protein [Leptospira sarikeiensis]TGL64889.1 hypothetical protein EHQ64_01075 [Leptospira sarikeiensis]